MSKAEQIEYFEYQLLSKNHEIDELKQELIQKLKKIVELEVDLEIHDDRFSSSVEAYSNSEGTGSHRTLSHHGAGGDGNQRASTATTSSSSSPKELFYVSNTQQLDRRMSSKKKSFKKLMSSFRKKGRRENSGSVRSGTMTADELSGNVAVDTLQNDLANLEARYKRDKYMSRMQIEQLKQENNDYLIKVLSLEKSLQKAEDSDEDEAQNNNDHNNNNNTGDDNGNSHEKSLPPKSQAVVQSTLSSKILEQKNKDFAKNKGPDLDDGFRGSQNLDVKTKLPNKTHFLEEKLQILENERVLHSKMIKELKAELASLKEDTQKQGLVDKLMLEKLELENQAQLVRVAALENELRAGGSTFSSSGLQANAAAELEDRLRQNYNEVIRLRKEHEMKDKKIEALRSEIIDLRLLRMQYEKAAQQQQRNEQVSSMSNPKLESITEDPVVNIHMQSQSEGGMIAVPAAMPCDEVKR